MRIDGVPFKAAVSVDNVIFGFDGEALKVLLIKRATEPYNKEWALPGDMVKLDEDLEVAALRILETMTGLNNVFLQQVHTFGAVNRHPDGRVITVAYYSLINIQRAKLSKGDYKVLELDWKDADQLESMPFDHLEIIQTCLEQLKRQFRYQPVGFELLPSKFTLTQLQKLYEVVLHKVLDKRNFRKKIMSLKVLSPLNESEEKVAHRPAQLFKFDPQKYEEAKAKGINFEI